MSGAFIDAVCTKCNTQIGWFGTMANKPACRKCGYREDQATLDAREKRMQEYLDHWHEPKHWGDGAMAVGKHPVPLTLDAVAALWPKGWMWNRHYWDGRNVWHAAREGSLWINGVSVPDLNDELHDRLLLLVAVLEHMEKERADDHS